MNKIAAWIYMDTEGSLTHKAVRLNQLLPPPKISFNETVGWIKYCENTTTDRDALHGWNAAVACMRRDAVILVQRRYRERYAKLIRARQIILDAFRDKIKRMR